MMALRKAGAIIRQLDAVRFVRCASRTRDIQRYRAVAS